MKFSYTNASHDIIHIEAEDMQVSSEQLLFYDKGGQVICAVARGQWKDAMKWGATFVMMTPEPPKDA